MVDLMTRAEFADRVGRLQKQTARVVLTILLPGILLLLLCITLYTLLDGPDWGFGLICVAAGGLGAAPALVLRRRQYIERFGLICPHCGRSVFGRKWGWHRQQSVLVTAVCGDCGKTFTSD